MNIENLVVPEKSLEDWVCANIADVVSWGDGVQVVDRQVKLPNGRIADVIAARRTGDYVDLFVIEIKRDRIELPAVTQLLEYMGMIHEMQERLRDILLVTGVDIHGLLVAPGITAAAAHCVNALEEVEFVCLELNISARTWYDISTADYDTAAQSSTLDHLCSSIPASPSMLAISSPDDCDSDNDEVDPDVIEIIAGTVEQDGGPEWASRLAEESF